jgi:hypothetical protein
MATTENEIPQDNANTDDQVEATQEPRDLEPEKDVKGGLWPSVITSTTYNKPI